MVFNGMSSLFRPVSNAQILLAEHFRCPDELCAEFEIFGGLSGEAGYFLAGSETICFGRSRNASATLKGTPLMDAAEYTRIGSGLVELGFDPVEVVDNLRRERYADGSTARSVSGTSFDRRLYYRVRPFLPTRVRRHIQKVFFHGWEKMRFPRWPVDRTVEDVLEQLLIWSLKAKKVDKIPFVWFWPDGFRSSAVITHDVETTLGVDFCQTLMDINDSFGIPSSFQIVPEERYVVTEAFLDDIRRRGHEVNVQDLNHDGLLFSSKDLFLRRSEQINEYARRFDALGFRAAVLYRNTDWLACLNVSYDMSIPNVAHLDPQRGGCCTVFPFYIGDVIELPVTTTQDYTLFNILSQYSVDLWKRQISLIREKHGLANFIVHPDYIIEDKPRQVYRQLLSHVAELRSSGDTWVALPRNVASWWRQRSQMTLARSGDSWHVQGAGSERASVAYAYLDGDKLTYDPPSRR